MEPPSGSWSQPLPHQLHQVCLLSVSKGLPLANQQIPTGAPTVIFARAIFYPLFLFSFSTTSFTCILPCYFLATSSHSWWFQPIRKNKHGWKHVSNHLRVFVQFCQQVTHGEAQAPNGQPSNFGINGMTHYHQIESYCSYHNHGSVAKTL